MSRQPELILEEQLITKLQELGYALVYVQNEAELIFNLKQQLEKHNNILFSDKEFEKVLNILSKGSVFEKAKTLRKSNILSGTMVTTSILNSLTPNNGVKISTKSRIRYRWKVNTKTVMMLHCLSMVCH